MVFLLNVTFDVPAKQLSGAMALVGLILLIPNVPRVVRFALGRSVGPAVSGLIWHNRIFVRITRWASPILVVVIIVGSGLATGISLNWGRPGTPEAITAKLYPVRKGAQTLIRDPSGTVEFRYSKV